MTRAASKVDFLMFSQQLVLCVCFAAAKWQQRRYGKHTQTHTPKEREGESQTNTHTKRVGETWVKGGTESTALAAEHWPQKLLKAIYTDAVYFETLVQDTPRHRQKMPAGRLCQDDARPCERRRHSANIFLYPVLNMASILCRKCAQTVIFLFI